MKRLFAAIGAAMFAVLVFAPTGPTLATQDVCAGLDSGKIDTTGDPATVTVTAPDGFLISRYCVKAGSDVSVPNGAVQYFDVDPPAKTITFGHPSSKAVSHWSLEYARVCEECTTTTEPTTDTTTEPTTTIEATTTTNSVPPTTGTVPDPTTTTKPTPTTKPPVVTSPLAKTGPGQTTTLSLFALAFLGLGSGAILATRRR